MRVFVRTLAACLVLVCASAAQELSFTAPNLSSVKGNGLPYYTLGQTVLVSWTTPFSQTTLLVFQARDNGTWAWQILALDYPNYQTSYNWTTAPVPGEKLSTNSFYFAVENGLSDTCNGCVDKSPYFRVLKPGQEDNGAATPSSSQTSSTGGPHPTSKGGSPAAASSTSSHSTDAHQSSNSHSNRVGLGVGLGLGIPVLALLAFLFFLVRRRRKQRRKLSYHPTGSGNWTQDQMREVGAGAGAGVGAGAGAEAETHDPAPPGERSRSEQSSPSQYSQSTPSQESNPFRPSYAASRMSHASWIDPFEFERPELKDQDAMSQLRSSIHGSPPSGTNTMVNSTPHSVANSMANSKGGGVLAGPSRKDVNTQDNDMSFAAGTDLSSLEGMPAQPQRAFSPDPSRFADGRNWPLP